MAREIGSIAVAVAVAYVTGSPQLGVAAGAYVYGATAPNAKVEGPRLNDLKAPQANYGAVIPYLEGQPRSAGVYAWYSEKRKIANESSEGGKGGPGVDTTLFTYELDALVLLSINEQAAVTRIWSNGKLIWSNSTLDAETLIASGETINWRAIRFYSGDSAQLPDPTYEAAVGIGNAPAYRGRASIFIEGMNLGQSGQLPILTYETASAGTEAFGRILANEDIGITFRSSGVAGVGTPAIVAVDSQIRIASVDTTAIYVFGLDGFVIETEAGSLGGTYQYPGDPGIGSTSYPVGMLNGAPIRMQYYGSAIGSTWILPIGAMSAYPVPNGLGGYYSGILYGVDLTNALPAGEYLGGVSLSTNGYAIIYTAPTNAALGTDIVDKWYIVSLTFVDGHATVTLIDNGTIAVPGSIYTWGFGNSATFHYAASVLNQSQDEVWVAYGAGGRDLVIYDIIGSVLTLRSTYTGLGGILGPMFSSPSIHLAGDIAFVVTGDTITTWGGNFAATLPTLDQVVSRLCIRTGLLTSGDIDVTALSVDTVRALAVTQVGPTRSTIEALMAAYLFEAVEGDKIKFVKRGGASVATIPYADMGAGDIEPLPLRRLNDIELPARVTVKFANTLNDFQDGSESGDRLVTRSTAVQVVELPLGLTPTEAKRVAEANTMDLAVSLIGIGPVALSRKYSRLEPTDVVTLTGRDGSTYRARTVKATAGAINTFEYLLDDASVISSVAATDSAYTATTLVLASSTGNLQLLDIPILRDADDSAGLYAVAKPSSGISFPGVVAYSSLDNTTYEREATITTAAVIGSSTTALTDYTGGNVFDEIGTVTVSVGAGELSSTTRDSMLDSGTNAALLGSEIFQFRTATLVSPGVYTLRGLLRGKRGTEWAMVDHATSERFVLFSVASMRRVSQDLSEIDTSAYWKGVPVGRSLSGTTSQTFTNTGIGLKPFSPVNLRAARDTNVTVTWDRRTRLSGEFASGVDVRLGEDSESYDVDVYLGASLVSTDTVTSASWTGVGLLAGHTAIVYQNSASVGRGYPAELDL